VVCRLALDRSKGEDTLFVVEDRDTGCNSLRPPRVGESVKTIEVQKTSLDNFLGEGMTLKVDFIKMEVEGAELNILEGAAELLGRRPRPVILAELSDCRSSGWGHAASAVYDLLVEQRVSCGQARKPLAIGQNGHLHSPSNDCRMRRV